MSSKKPTEYIAFLPNTLLTVVNSKAFIPFLLASPTSDQVSPAALAATQHQRHAELLTLPTTATLASVLAFFQTYDITAVPLVEQHSAPAAGGHGHAKAKAKKGALSPKDVVGIFTMQDLLRPLMFHPIFDEAPSSLWPQHSAASATTAKLSEEAFLSQLSSLPIWSSPVLPYMSCNASNRSEWFLLGKQTAWHAAVALSSGLRHVLVVEGDDINGGHPASISMLSAGDLARFIYTSLPEDTSEESSLPPALSRLLCSKVSQHLTSTSMITFSERDITLNAFRRLAGSPTAATTSSAAATPRTAAVSSIGAVPIVNSSNHVVDTLSATDVRLLTPHTFSRILSPLSEYLHSLRHSVPAAASASSAVTPRNLRPAFAATVFVDVSISTLLAKAVTLGISRIWVVDDDARPVGVMSLSDVFRMIVQLRLDQ